MSIISGRGELGRHRNRSLYRLWWRAERSCCRYEVHNMALGWTFENVYTAANTRGATSDCQHWFRNHDLDFFHAVDNIDDLAIGEHGVMYHVPLSHGKLTIRIGSIWVRVPHAQPSDPAGRLGRERGLFCATHPLLLRTRTHQKVYLRL